MSCTHKTKSQRTIFVIDDDKDMIELNRMLLEFHGYKVVTACSGKEALYLLNRIQKPDLILLDYHLQDMLGPEFLKILEKVNSQLVHEVPIVFLTARSEVPKSSAVGYIQKSSDMDGFLQRVDKFISLPMES